ncbi:hypothetical protein [Leucobacter sp. cx-169]|uniref:hypothetical protein n=1 Tax=Leucobacter sp. cx-169 TaxID=2770549 RepID=UPI00165DBD52|nr:hypothetical protein [Leucobacter sp. cx-169]MBC9927392.1 hypothetical protein [Leucobacter sp. cx-169]
MSNLFQARVFSFTRSGAPLLSAQDFANRASSEIGSIPDGATFIVRRTERGLQHLFVTDDSSGQEGVAFNISQTIHAHVEEVDEAPDLGDVACIAQLVFLSDSMFGQSTQAGAEVTTVAEVIGSSLREGDWVAMSIRKPSRAELKAQASWLSGHGVVQHQSLAAGARVASIWAGGAKDTAPLNVTRLANALAGFGIHASPVVRSARKVMAPVITAGFAVTVAGIAASTLARKMDSPPELLSWWPVLLGLGIAAQVYGILGTGIVPRLPSKWRTMRRLLAWGRVPQAPRRLWKAKGPQPQRLDKDTGVIIPAVEGEYPLAPTSFMVAPHFPMMVIAPHAGSFSGTGQTANRPAPQALTVPSIGPEVGESHGVPAFLTWSDMWSGTFLVGEPGSGKTALLEWFWGETCRQVKAGARITPVALDTKGDGQTCQQMVAWAESHKLPIGTFHVADTRAGYAIDLFPRVGSVHQQARRIMDAFVYLYGEVSVGARSVDTLTRVFTAALTITPSLIVSMPGNGSTGIMIEPDRSPFYYANILLGGFGDVSGKMLAEHMMLAAVQPDANEDLGRAREQLMPIYDPQMTVARRRELLEAPRNKVSALLGMEHWWSAPGKVGWPELLNSHHPIVINTGIAPNGEQPTDRKITEEMGALLLYSMRQAIQETCVGWQADGRAVRIFADEVKAVAAASPEVVTWFRSDGRSFGVEAVLATQQPRQLAQEVRAAMMSFGTLIAFTQNEETTVNELVKNLALDGSEWSPQDLTMLPRYNAIVRTSVEQTRQPAFTVAVCDFRARRAAA